MTPTYQAVREAIEKVCGELTELHVFNNGRCDYCNVERIWQERTPRDQMTGEAVYGSDPLKADGVMVEVTNHDETSGRCYVTKKTIYLHHVLRAVEEKYPCLGNVWVEMTTDGWMFKMFKNERDEKGYRDGAQWNTYKSLEDQNEELHLFLKNILCK